MTTPDLSQQRPATSSVPAGTPTSSLEAPRAPVKRTAWTLGILGLLPFVIMAGLLLYAGRDFIAFNQLVLGLAGYSAVILAFLGGVRWGTAILTRAHPRRTVILSVLPAIVGWLLLFVPSPWVFAAFALAFLLTGVWDFVASRGRTLPTWFGTLRVALTVVVVLCHVAAFFSTYG